MYGGFRGGGGGGMGGMQQMLKQAQKMQEQMQAAQEELAESEVEGASGGGMVKITLSGKKELKAVKIDPKCVDADDIEMLEDLIIAAFGDAAQKADKMSEELMGPFGQLGLF
ncbi:MAG: YbaB/EbfC family nucleoid-associated protein [Firmicutes bacterium]|nr:YbaB/EbfC family nucleoid-associated protein [Bacillota bacterium]